ncbi:hypothetical protein RI129_009284 [Pyrocoelia pectoralis]|uniref:DUF1868 domain-containing protein n=1 Tax=Pyrocoelia pectoralis TaxID=417401 RepID=A0AAN7V498_9COLE
MIVFILCWLFIEKKVEMAGPKVDETGVYKPFFGYTTLSLVEDVENHLKSVEDFLSTSIISRYYAPLPHFTYHMTLYNTYAMAIHEPIPAVRRWLDERGETGAMSDQFLPENVLQSQHILAVGAIQHHIGNRNLTISDVTLKKGKDVIKVSLELEAEDHFLVQSLRESLAKIYEHPDQGLRYHITLAYLYKHLPRTGLELKAFEDDFVKLQAMVETFKNYKLNKHNVFLFDSMINFMPYIRKPIQVNQII